MKSKRLAISLVVSATMLMNTIGVYADAQSIEQAWNQLSSTQQSKLEEVGINTGLFNKMESILDVVDVGSLGYKPLTYENGNFVVSNQDAKKVLDIISMISSTNPQDNMIDAFNDVISDINSSSSTSTKEDFAKLLETYGLCSVKELEAQLPVGGGGGGGAAKVIPAKVMQEKLEETLLNLENLQVKDKSQVANVQEKLITNIRQTLVDIKQADPEFAKTYISTWLKQVNKVNMEIQQYDKAQVATLERNHQVMLEVLSSYMTEPLTALDSNSVQKAWKESATWIQKHGEGMDFDKASSPVARLQLKENQEVMVSNEIWEDAPDYARIELGIDNTVMLIDKNTYSNGISKIKIESLDKDGYKEAVNISSTSKMYYPAKVIFHIEDEAPQHYGVYRLDGDKEVIVGGIYNPVRGAVEASINASGIYALKKAPAKAYTDLEGAAWAKNEIEHLGQKGYIDGKAEGVYGPLDKITRAEFAVLMARILQLPQGNTLNNFEDMKTDAWYYNGVMATVEAKLFSGKDASTFDPNGNITRQEVAAVLARVLVQKGYNEPEVETDQKGIWAPEALALMKNQDLTTQVPNFNDNVGQNANRAEVAYILYNLLQR